MHGFGFEHPGFALQERVIVAGPPEKPSAIQLDNPVGQAPEKGPVVRDKKQTHRVPEQKILQPEDGSEVQMVRRLIEQEQIRLPGQRPGQQHAAFQSAGKRGERGLGRQLHFGQQILQPHIDLPILLVPGRRNPTPHHREHRSLHPLRNFLIQTGHDRAGRTKNLPRARPLLPGDQPHQAGFAAAIAPQQGHPFAPLDRKIGPVEEVIPPVVKRDRVQLQQSHGRVTLPQKIPGATPKSGRNALPFGIRRKPPRSRREPTRWGFRGFLRD